MDMTDILKLMINSGAAEEVSQHRKDYHGDGADDNRCALELSEHIHFLLYPGQGFQFSLPIL